MTWAPQNSRISIALIDYFLSSPFKVIVITLHCHIFDLAQTEIDTEILYYYEDNFDSLNSCHLTLLLKIVGSLRIRIDNQVCTYFPIKQRTLSISKLQFLFIFLLCIDHISLKNFSNVFMKNPLNVSSSYMMLVIELSPSKAPYYFLQSSTQFNTFLLKSCGGAKIFPWEWGRCVSAWCRIQSICLNKEP